MITTTSYHEMSVRFKLINSIDKCYYDSDIITITSDNVPGKFDLAYSIISKTKIGTTTRTDISNCHPNDIDVFLNFIGSGLRTRYLIVCNVIVECEVLGTRSKVTQEESTIYNTNIKISELQNRTSKMRSELGLDHDINKPSSTNKKGSKLQDRISSMRNELGLDPNNNKPSSTNKKGSKLQDRMNKMRNDLGLDSDSTPASNKTTIENSKSAHKKSNNLKSLIAKLFKF